MIDRSKGSPGNPSIVGHLNPQCNFLYDSTIKPLSVAAEPWSSDRHLWLNKHGVGRLKQRTITTIPDDFSGSVHVTVGGWTGSGDAHEGEIAIAPGKTQYRPVGILEIASDITRHATDNQHRSVQAWQQMQPGMKAFEATE